MNAYTLRARRRSAGFSLVEILIALGIFLIGMTAIVSLFPAAAILQRETTQEVISGMAAQSARSIIESQTLTYAPGSPGTGDLRNYYTVAGYNDTDAVPMNAIGITGGTLMDRFPSFDRSYPTGVIDMGAGSAFDAIANCDLHWVPFIQDLAGDQSGSAQLWVLRLFIVESDSRATYAQGNASDANPNDPTNFPKVRSVGVSASGDEFTLGAGTDLEPGDTVMDSNGNSHVITEINGSVVTVLNSIPQTPAAPNKLWYAPRQGGTSSPTQRIVTVEVEVVAP